MELHSDTRGRDPVSIAIENLLYEMQANGMGVFFKASSPAGFSLRFGGMHSEGETIDIALVRLASAMMDDVRYVRFLIETLHAPMKAAG